MALRECFARIMEILYEAKNDVNDVNEFGYNSAESEPIWKPALVAEWLTHSASMCSRAWRAQWPGFDSARARPPTKELFLIIPMHMMNREIIPGR